MEKTCPLGHTCDKCKWMIRMRGTNPNTGQEVDQDDCAIAWMPILLLENSQQQRQTAAAVESTRNVFAEGTHEMARAMIMAAKTRQLEVKQ